MSSTDDVLTRLEAGANLVQVYTALVYEGPMLVSRMNRELASWLEREGTTLETYLRAVR
jgi:dihydroorotate dehydrogenase